MMLISKQTESNLQKLVLIVTIFISTILLDVHYFSLFLDEPEQWGAEKYREELKK